MGKRWINFPRPDPWSLMVFTRTWHGVGLHCWSCFCLGFRVQVWKLRTFVFVLVEISHIHSRQCSGAVCVVVLLVRSHISDAEYFLQRPRLSLLEHSMWSVLWHLKRNLH